MAARAMFLSYVSAHDARVPRETPNSPARRGGERLTRPAPCWSVVCAYQDASSGTRRTLRIRVSCRVPPVSLSVRQPSLNFPFCTDSGPSVRSVAPFGFRLASSRANPPRAAEVAQRADVEARAQLVPGHEIRVSPPTPRIYPAPPVHFARFRGPSTDDPPRLTPHKHPVAGINLQFSIFNIDIEHAQAVSARLQ